jgi:hypothetical protein
MKTKTKMKVQTIEKVTIHPEKYELNISQYREELFKCGEPILQAYGMNKEELNRLRDDLVNNQQKRIVDYSTQHYN